MGLVRNTATAGNWLRVGVDGSVKNNEHRKMTEFLKDLKVVSDLVGRFIKDLQCYKNYSLSREDILVVVNQFISLNYLPIFLPVHPTCINGRFPHYSTG